MAARGKDYVGLETSPALRPAQGNTFFLVRYQVINHGQGITTVPNNAAIHLIHKATNKLTDVDVPATNANVESGAATGMPDQLTLEPERPQIQTLAFQIPSNTNVNDIAILVTEPRDPTRVFQLVQVSN
ncbi:MAG: hypothetical protein K2W95_11930 [Candidatus Obscuribacterales bacterium]|nr:hypothetical protein [Candidatus Obscuribacterales bacterium]